MLYVKISSLQNATTAILMDAAVKMLRQQTLINGINAINMNALGKGMYHLEVINGNEVKYFKLQR